MAAAPPGVIALLCLQAAHAAVPTKATLDTEAARAMQATQAKGLAIAVIDEGKVVRVRSYGVRNAAGDPLRTDTIMYGASLTKAVFAYTVMQRVEEKKLDLDKSIGDYLVKPLPEYADKDAYAHWPSLAGDERWRAMTPHILPAHSAGFANFYFVEPDEKLHLHRERSLEILRHQ
ncbi:serine hydrolase domain-containing protein [Pseudoxanthomonas sacheonensis]|uniref:serine hydrolase domain-containing protein n=1 Tax=Pseudoxanthomonas sacheonensis TaxID=443615 RepID=UPI001BA6F146|nr:serine hydrolase domain-containing protein [Pseudoxanthomonas sacheonensis]